jgi:hypothetical protein
MEVFMRRFSLISISIIAFICGSSLQATVSVKVKGLASGASIVQGDTISWTISGIATGGTVTNQLWIDLDSNGVASSSKDILYQSFSQTDGVTGDPGDMDGSVNGVIYVAMPNIGLAPAHYIFKTIYGTDTASATFTETALPSPTYTISGTVKKSGIGVANILINGQSFSGSSEWDALTNASGSYTINTNEASGKQLRVKVVSGSLPSGYTASPERDTVTLTSNVTNLNFILTSGRFVTGTVTNSDGNPVAGLNVGVYPVSGGDGYDANTDASGKYVIAADTGKYKVKFGNDEDNAGYIITYYNQQHVDFYGDTVKITSTTDTIKNINAVLYKGGVITGTMKNGTTLVQGSIAAFAYNAYGNQLYQGWYDAQNASYYFVVAFNQNNGSASTVYYNQTAVYPGTAVTVSAVGDTVKNINVDFGGTIAAVEKTSISAKSFELNQNYPNPFNPSTRISFSLPSTELVVLKVYDLLGRDVATLVNEVKTAGSYTATFHAETLPSGVYFYRLQAGNYTTTKKLVLMK